MVTSCAGLLVFIAALGQPKGQTDSKRDTSWQEIHRDGFSIVIPTGWNETHYPPDHSTKLQLTGDGVWVPRFDETGSFVTLGIQAYKLGPFKGDLADYVERHLESLAGDSGKAAPSEQMKLIDGSNAVFFSVQQKLPLHGDVSQWFIVVARDHNSDLWLFRSYLSCDEKSNLLEDAAPALKRLRAHLESVSFDRNKLSDKVVRQVYTDTEDVMAPKLKRWAEESERRVKKFHDKLAKMPPKPEPFTHRWQIVHHPRFSIATPYGWRNELPWNQDNPRLRLQLNGSGKAVIEDDGTGRSVRLYFEVEERGPTELDARGAADQHFQELTSEKWDIDAGRDAEAVKLSDGTTALLVESAMNRAGRRTVRLDLHAIDPQACWWNASVQFRCDPKSKVPEENSDLMTMLGKHLSTLCFDRSKFSTELVANAYEALRNADPEHYKRLVDHRNRNVSLPLNPGWWVPGDPVVPIELTIGEPGTWDIMLHEDFAISLPHGWQTDGSILNPDFRAPETAWPKRDEDGRDGGYASLRVRRGGPVDASPVEEAREVIDRAKKSPAARVQEGSIRELTLSDGSPAALMTLVTDYEQSFIQRYEMRLFALSQSSSSKVWEVTVELTASSGSSRFDTHRALIYRLRKHLESFCFDRDKFSDAAIAKAYGDTADE